MVRISLFHGDVIYAWLCAVICTYALAGARGVSVCHRAFVCALVLSMWFVAWDTLVAFCGVVS